MTLLIDPLPWLVPRREPPPISRRGRSSADPPYCNVNSDPLPFDPAGFVAEALVEPPYDVRPDSADFALVGALLREPREPLFDP